MADPRKIVSFTEINAVFATYKIDNTTITYDKTKANGSAQVGLAVSLSAAGTVELTQDADSVEGKLISVEADGFCTVQTGGYCTLPSGAGATLTLGAKIVGDLDTAARGFVRTAASAVAAELLVARGRIVDASVTSAVVVDLG